MEAGTFLLVMINSTYINLVTSACAQTTCAQNFVDDGWLSIIITFLISLFGGVIAAVVSVYVTIDYTFLKQESYSYNNKMKKIRNEIDQMKHQMKKSIFDDQLEKIRLKSKEKLNVPERWIGLDKFELPTGGGHRYLPNYELSYFTGDISKTINVYFHKNIQLLEKVRLLNLLKENTIQFNNNIQNIENVLQVRLIYPYPKYQEQNLALIEECIKSLQNEYSKFKPIFDDYLDEINVKNGTELYLEVKFLPTIWASILKALKLRKLDTF
jgi:hypothetical protein